MKRLLAFLLAAISVFSLTACAQLGTASTDKYQLTAAQYPQMAQYPDESKYNNITSRTA